MIAHLMQRSGRLPQGRLDDHDGAVRGKKWQELADHRSSLYRRICRGRKQFIQGICDEDEIIRPAPYKLLTKVALERMFQVTLDTSEDWARYSDLLTIGLPQPLRVMQR